MGRVHNPGIGRGGSFFGVPPSGAVQIPEFSRYYIKQDGSVWTTWRVVHARKMRPRQKSDTGYLVLALTDDNDQRRLCSVHRLVLIAFVGCCPDGCQCRHLNGIKTDNRLENLAWGTPAENTADAIRLGELKTVLSESDVKLIIDAYWRERNAVSVARMFGVSSTTVRAIASGKTWKHIPRPGSLDSHGIRINRGGRAVECQCGHQFYSRSQKPHCSACKSYNKTHDI